MSMVLGVSRQAFVLPAAVRVVLLLLLAAGAEAQGVRLNEPLVRPFFAGDVLEARLSPDSTRVVYRADQDNDDVFELYSVPLAGGPSLRLNGLLVPDGDVLAFAVSPDSSRVVYLADQDVDEVVELYSVAITGGAVLELSAPLIAGGDVRSFQTSPDSSRVVYRADQEVVQRIELYSVALGGGPVVKLNGGLPAGGNIEADGFAISPDSSRVVYLADQDADQLFELFSVPLAGGAIVQLNATLRPGGDVLGGFQVSPDSSRVVYRADQDTNDTIELFSVPLAGGGGTKLNPAMVFRGDVQAGFLVAADSSRVVYTADQDVDGSIELFSVSLTGGGATQLNPPLIEGGYVELGFRIAPDSSRVVYKARQDSAAIELYGVLLAGGPAVRLNPCCSVYDFQISPDSSAVVYRRSASQGVELVRTPITGGPTRLMGGGTVTAFAFSADSSRVVFLSEHAGVHELYSASLGGGSIRLNPPLVPGGSVQPAFAVSPDATRVVYLANQLTAAAVELFSVPIAGSTATRLNPPLAPFFMTAGDVHLALISPDGRSVVFSADREVEGLGLFSFELPTGPAVALDVESVSHSRPQISPDSTRIVHAADPYGRSLRSTPIGGGASITLLAAPPGGSLGGFLLSADSSRVVCAADLDDDDDFQLYSVPIDVPIGGGTATQLNAASGGIRDAFGPPIGARISPDSSRVVYLADQDQPGVPELYSVSIQGGSPTKLNLPLSAPRQILLDFEISPDSSRVVYLGDQDATGVFELYSVPLAGGTPTRLNPSLVSGGHVLRMLITPDSSHVVYLADPQIRGLYELYSVPIAGGASTRLNDPLVAGGAVLHDVGSFQIAPDSTRVVYVADQDTNDVFELYSAPIDGSASPVRLNRPLVGGGDVGLYPDPLIFFQLAAPRISPDGSWVVYRADQDTNDAFELYAVPLTGGPARKLNPPLAGDPCGDSACTIGVELDFSIAADSGHVFLRALTDPTRGQELYAARLDGGAPKELNAPLVALGSVRSFVQRDNSVVYLADQDERDAVEVFLSFVSRPARRAR